MLIIDIKVDIDAGLFTKITLKSFKKGDEISLIYIRTFSNMCLKYLQSKLNYFRDLQLDVSQKIILKSVVLESELKITNELYSLYIKSDKITEEIQILEIHIQLIKKLK